MTYGEFKDLPRRTASHKVFGDKAFSIAKNLKYGGYERVLALVVDRFFDKLSATRANKCAGGAVKNGKYIKSRISWRITQTNYLKIWKT